MKGQTLIELLLVIGLSAIILPALLTGLVAGRSGKAQQVQRLEAVAILKETEEAVRSVRENDWNTFAINGTYHPEVSGSSWILASGSATINGFTQQIVISDVERDASGAIVSSAGTVDPSSKKIVITVSWGTPLPSSIQSTIYLMRLDNITYVETTEADFDNGTIIGTTVTNTSGGEIILGGGGQGQWCNPGSQPIVELDLPGQGITTAISAVEGKAYTTTGGNASGHSMDGISINNSNPPVATNLSPYDHRKTYGIFTDGGYSYLTSDHPSLTVDIVQVTTEPFSQVGTFKGSGAGKGESVYVVGNVGYVTAESKLYTFDLSSKTGSRPQLGSINLAGKGKRVIVIGSYAYVATGSTTNQLQIFDISNPNNLILAGQTGSLNDKGAIDVFVNSTGTRAYIVTSVSSAQKEFFIIDTSNKSNPALVSGGSYEANGMDPKGVTVVTGNKAVIVGTGGEEYQVIDITNESSLSRCGGLEIDTGVNGVASVLEADGDAYSYIISGDSSKEFKIIEGGPGGQYSSDGTFESQTIPIPMPANDTSFNRFEVNINRPSQADIKFQVAVAQAVLGSCSGVTFNFVGDDGTNSTFFDTSVTTGTETFGYAIPTAINPGQCFRYKSFLSTLDPSQTPIFYDITINYAP